MSRTETSDRGNQAPQSFAEQPDQEWFVLTDGMEPYERFRFIARHVLSKALDEIEAYIEDDRIFEDQNLEDDQAAREHLEALDAALREDGTIGSLEREFLCAAVSSVMADRDLRARCHADLLRIAKRLGPDPSRAKRWSSRDGDEAG